MQLSLPLDWEHQKAKSESKQFRLPRTTFKSETEPGNENNKEMQ